MILVDVNVLVYAQREDAPDHRAYRSWLEAALTGDEAFGFSELVLSGFVRVVTHTRVFDPPTPTARAFQFADVIRECEQAVPVAPGPRHWAIFSDLCRGVGAKGNTVPDAYLAALAIESGSEWISADRGFAHFSGLRWRHPLDA